MYLRTWAALGTLLAGGVVPHTVLWGQIANVETVALRRNMAVSPPRSIRLDVEMVLVPVTVTDPYERLVEGLNKKDFRLFDDGVEQNISQFYRDDGPISVGIVFDASNSMVRRMDMSRRAISMFLARCGAGDEFFVIRFSDRPQRLQPFTMDTGLVEDVVKHIQPEGWTALYDAIHLGISDMKRAAHASKVLLVLSDGGDNNSRYNEREIKSIVQEGDVRLYAISIFDRSSTLEKLADNSGGRAYRVRKLDELPDLASRISEELHSQYVLGYNPSDSRRQGKYRKLKVELAPKQDAPPLRASWRRGYYEPSR